jgi:hypothetical protein
MILADRGGTRNQGRHLRQLTHREIMPARSNAGILQQATWSG